MAERDVTSWIPNLLGPLDLEVEGAPVDVPRRSTFNFVGMTVTDDPDNDRTNIEAVGGGGGAAPTGTGVATVTSGSFDAASSLGTSLQVFRTNAAASATEWSDANAGGRSTLAMADANQTVSASVRARKIIQTTGALTADRTATMPHPASEDASYTHPWWNDCTGKDLIVSTGTGTTVRLCPGMSADLRFTPSGVSVSSIAVVPEVVNVADFLFSSDPAPTIDGHTTKNIDLALGRALASRATTKRRCILWIPPVEPYGIAAWSWRTAITYQIDSANANLMYLEIRASGEAGKLICDTTTVGIVTKLTVSSGGPEGMPTNFKWINFFWCGQGTTHTVDCASLLVTSADMQVTIEDCTFYGLLSNNTSGLLDLSSMGLAMRRCYFHHCGNTTGKATISLYSGIFGALFEQVQFYNYERNNDPWGAAALLNKLNDAAQYCYSIWLRGDTVDNAPRARLVQCNFGSVGNLGAVLADPSADGFYIKSVHFQDCTFIYNARRVIRAVSNVESITLENCRVYHNDASVDSIALLASSCEHLAIIRTKFSGDWHRIKANTGQKSVKLEQSSGGSYTVDGCGYLDIDDSSTWDALASSTTPAPGAKRAYTSISVVGTSDITLTATQYARRNIVLSGEPGGAFNVIGPADANADGADYVVTNLTDGAATFKAAGETGVTIAIGKSATVRYIDSQNDYVQVGTSNGGATSPGGSNTQVQFNDSSAFGGDAGLTYDKTNDVLSTGKLSLGTTPETTALIRVPYATNTRVLGAKDSGGTDRDVLSQRGSNTWRFGHASGAFNTEMYGGDISIFGTSSTGLLTTSGSGYAIYIDSTKLRTGLPLCGSSVDSVPFRLDETAITKSDATDLTLTAAQYQNPVLAITGTPGGAFNVIAPNTAKAFYIVDNQSNQACTIKKSGGTGITIAANKCAQVRHNGTDYVRVTADV